LLFGVKKATKDAEDSVGGGIFGDLLSGGASGIFDRILGDKDKYTRLPIPGQGGAGMMGQQATGLMGALNPINAGMSIANQAVDLYNKTIGRIGAGRKSADEVVKSQESFVNQTLKGILDDGALSATNKLKIINNEWETFQANLDRFAAAGDKNSITANQAFATVSPLVAKIKQDLIAAGASISGVTDGAMDFTVFESSVSEFASAVTLFSSMKGVTASTAAMLPTAQPTVTQAPMPQSLASAFNTLSSAITTRSANPGSDIVYEEGVLDPFLEGDKWMTGLQNILNPIIEAQQKGKLSQAQLSTGISSFDAAVAKFREIADSLARVDYGDPAEVAAGYAMLNPLIDKLRTALTGAAAATTTIPSLAIGGFLKRSGLVMAHAGEVVMPLNQIRAKMDAARPDDGSNALGAAIAQMFGKPQQSEGKTVAAEIKSSMGAAIAAMFGKSEKAATGGDTHNHFQVDIRIDHVEDYDDFIAKIGTNHHGGAEIIGRKILKVVPGLISNSD
jgi:hypothetical protein